MEMVLTYYYKNGNEKNYGILKFKDGVLDRGDIFCKHTDIITIISSYVDTGKTKYGKAEYYKTSLESLRYKFSTENLNYDTILKYVDRCNISLIDLFSIDSCWYIYNSAEDVVNYLCDNCLVDEHICEVWGNYGIEYLNASKICQDYTVTKLSGEDCTEFLYDEEDKVWVSIIRG